MAEPSLGTVSTYCSDQKKKKKKRIEKRPEFRLKTSLSAKMKANVHQVPNAMIKIKRVCTIWMKDLIATCSGVRAYITFEGSQRRESLKS